MSASSTFELSMGDRVVRAELLHDDAPRICGAFQDSLPLRSFGVNAKFAGEETIVMLPFYEEAENVVGSVSPGDIGYYPSRQTLCLFYGEIMPFASVSLFARVLPEDLPAAQAAGREIHEGGPRMVRLSAAGPSRARPRARNEAVARLERHLQDVWENEPKDVRQLRGFSRPPLGNMPCVAYANFDLFWAVENLQVCRELAQGDQLSASRAGHVSASLVRRTVSRLSPLGVPGGLCRPGGGIGGLGVGQVAEAGRRPGRRRAPLRGPAE